MKIRDNHFRHMDETIRQFYNGLEQEINTYAIELKQSGQFKDYHKRLRWDICNSAGLTPYICRELYTYLNDSHIDTALKAILNNYSFYTNN